MRRAICLLSLAAAFGCAKSETTVNEPRNTKRQSDGWLVYEDDMFRAEYPPGSDITGAYQGKQDRTSPNLAIVPLPHGKNSPIGGFFLRPAKETKGMLLRDAIQNEIAFYKSKTGTLLSLPRDFSVKNGKCIGAIVISPTDNCPKGAGACYAPLYQMQCDGPNGARYSAGTVLTSGPANNALSPQAQQEAAVYERILRSLEFKKS